MDPAISLSRHARLELSGVDRPVVREVQAPSRYGLSMHSWRDGLSVAAQADLDQVLDASLGLARRSLAEASEFDPFALVTDVEGRLLAVDVDTSALGKHPDSLAIARGITTQLKTLTDSARCTALTLNTRLSQERTDALEVRLDHREGASLIVLLPYKRPKFGGRLEFGELKAFAGPRDVWG